MKQDAIRPTPRRLNDRTRTHRIGRLQSRLLLYAVLLAGLSVINALTYPGKWWVLWVALGLGIASLAHAWRVYVTPRFLK